MGYIVQRGQSLLDVVLMVAGTMEAGMDVAAVNGMGLSDLPEVGTVIEVASPTALARNDGAATDVHVLRAMAAGGVVVGTAGNG